MRSSKKQPADLNQIAALIAAKATEAVPTIPQTPEGKNAAAVALGRLGGLKGGKARAKTLSASRRKEIAQKAAQARWKSKKST
jgi:hypothetical protein